MRFKYAAKTRDGLTVKRGEIDAPNRDSAIKWMRDRNLVVYALTEAKEDRGLFDLTTIFGIPLSEKVKFTDQLASMITAGLPLTRSLEILVTQTKQKRMGEITQEILNDVESGSPLAKSMEKHPQVFDKSYVSLIRAGEASGQLDNVLTRLADSLEKQRQFISKVRGAMLYPAIVVTAMILVFILVVVFMIPRMTSIYDSFQVDLPATTRFFIFLSDFIINFWWAMILMVAGLVVGLRYFKSTPQGDYVFSKFIFRVPVFGGIIKQSIIVEFTRTLGLLTESGVSLVEALEIIRDGISNTIFKNSTSNILEDIKHGYPLSQAVTKEINFPPFVSQMLLVGEETGTVDKRLNSLAEYYEGEVDKVVKNISTLLEPFILVILGIMVFLLVISVVLPIYQLTTSIA